VIIVKYGAVAIPVVFADVTAVDPSDVAEVFLLVGRTEVKFRSAKQKRVKCVVYCTFNDLYKTTIIMPMNQSIPTPEAYST